MKRLLLLLLLLINIFSTSIAYAEDFNYPNSNDLKYPDYEVTFINNFLINVDAVLTKISVLDDSALIDFVITYKYNIQNSYNKMYSVFVLNTLALTLEEKTIDIAQNTKVNDYLATNETSDDYSDANIWNKFLVWVLLRDSSNSDISSTDFYSRRVKLLKTITEKNNKYSALASYLLNEIESISFNKSTDKINANIMSLKKYVENYQETEFAAQASVSILNKYIALKDYDKAVSQCKIIVTHYPNFFNGISDLYFDAYVEMLEMYKQQNNKEMVTFFINNLNKNSKGYNDIVKYYSKYIK